MKINLTRLVVLIIVACIAILGYRAFDHRPVIAVVTLMSHPALDSFSEACVTELGRLGYPKWRTRYLFRNANGQVTDAGAIAQSLKIDEPVLIIAITTPMAQAVVGSKPNVPVVFGAVTDPLGAKVVHSLTGAGNGLVTGSSDAWPYSAQLKLIREMMPNLRRLGVLYNPGESASQYGIRMIREAAQQEGIELVEGAVNSTIDVQPVAESLADRCDALFLSSDNTVIGGVAGAVSVAVSRKKPLFAGDSGTVAKGAAAAVSVGYPQLGRETAQLAVRALRGERDLPVLVSQGEDVYLNARAAELMGLKIPESVSRRAVNIYTQIEP